MSGRDARPAAGADGGALAEAPAATHIDKVDLIIAAPDEATRALLRERLSAAGLLGGAHVGTIERPAQLIEQLAAEGDAAPATRAGTLVVTAQGSPDRQEFTGQEFMGVALARGVPVLVWPLPLRA